MIRVAYLLVNPRPARPRLDAAVQEASLLGARFPGPIVYLYPGRRLRRVIPRWLCGAGRRGDLRRLEQEVDFHLLLSDAMRPYPFLRQLEKPLVYSLMTGLESSRLPWFRPAPRPGRRMVVSSHRDRKLLEARGYGKVAVVPPGLELGRFTRRDPPAGRGFVVMAGSAPWTGRQFRTKGVDLWLRTARAMPDLRLIFLWRGAFEKEIINRVSRLGLEDRVEIVTDEVDVDQVLARCHAAAVLSANSRLVRAFPHSLLESLAAGRPVLVSRTLGLAEFVEEQGCGEVINDLRAESLHEGLSRLIECYEERRARALEAPLERFSVEAHVSGYRSVFEDLSTVCAPVGSRRTGDVR